jgi:hypothetical protein
MDRRLWIIVQGMVMLSHYDHGSRWVGRLANSAVGILPPLFLSAIIFRRTKGGTWHLSAIVVVYRAPTYVHTRLSKIKPKTTWAALQLWHRLPWYILGHRSFSGRWSIQAATFVDRLTATFYSREKVRSTPYTLLFNEPFPDASIIVPFGCGALVLLRKEDRAKFKSRCTLMVFLHYATSHPIYTYAFYSPLTKQVVFRQDCIFLVMTFPMRAARALTAQSPPDSSLVPVRSALCLPADTDDELSFQHWQYGDALPDYTDEITGHSLTDFSPQPRQDTIPFPCDWPRQFPYHASFGPRSMVPVPVPPSIPRDVSAVTPGPTTPPITYTIPVATPSDDALPENNGDDDTDTFPELDDDDTLLGHLNVSRDKFEEAVAAMDSTQYDRLTIPSRPSQNAVPHLDPPAAYTVHDRERDHSRGMGHHLRWPQPGPHTKRTAPNLTPSLVPVAPVNSSPG